MNDAQRRVREIMDAICEGLMPETDAGVHYSNAHRKAAEIRKAIAAEADPDVRRILRRELERAEYVGD